MEEVEAPQDTLGGASLNNEGTATPTETIVNKFFFFQAEDGIRDTSVTGVQTCALPICSREGCLRAVPGKRRAIDLLRRHRARHLQLTQAIEIHLRTASLGLGSIHLRARLRDRKSVV